MTILKSITPSGFFGASVDNIQIKENFLFPEELEFLAAIAPSLDFWEPQETFPLDADHWYNRVALHEVLLKQNPRIPMIINDIQRRIKREIDKFYKVVAQPTGPSIVRWMPGYKQEPHADKEIYNYEKNSWESNSNPLYDIGSVFYLNNDYEGGEIYFPQFDIHIRPKAGDMYFFPGDRNYLHGVKEVTSGTRYTCPTFFTVIHHLK